MDDVIEITLHGEKAAGRVARIRTESLPLVEQYRWNVWEVPEKNWGPYATARVGTGRGAPRKYMHQLITGYPLTDHEDHDGLNNCRENLRESTRRQNLWNQRPIRGGTSVYKGVFLRPRGRWRAAIKVDGRFKSLGQYATPEEAAIAYDIAATETFGAFACLNFPEVINASR